MSTATKYADPIRINTGNATRTIGIPVGSAASALNVSVAALAKTLSALLGRATEIREHTGMLESEKNDRLHRLQPEAVKATRALLNTLASEATRVQALSATASYVRPSSSLPPHTLAEDQLLLQKFMGMNISERTQLTARCMADPVQHLRWAECLLRAPRELTDIPLQMHNELRFAVLAAFDQPQVEAIEAQEAQVSMAQRAADIAQQLLAENFVGSLQELQAEPPEPETPAAITPEQYLAAVPQAVIDDLRSGGRLSRLSAVELAARVQA